MTPEQEETLLALRLTTMAVSAIHNIRLNGIAGDLDVEVSDRIDAAEQTQVTTMRVRVRANEK